MTLQQIAPLPDGPAASAPPGRFARVAAVWWWLLKRHLAERHGLPRDAAGPRP